MRARPTKPRKDYVAEAHARAALLGPLRPVEPAGRLSDGAPTLGPGQAYATRSGEVYHPRWCEVIAQLWDNKPDGLLVIMADEVGGRRCCKTCLP